MAEQYIPQNILDALPKQLATKTVKTPKGIMGGGFYESQVIEPPPNAIPVMAKGPAMPGGAKDMPTGEYYIPLDLPNYPKTDARGYPVPPLVAKYDASGNLQTITAQTRYLADGNISIQPEYGLKGELLSANPLNNAEGEGGGIGDFVSTAFKDFAPMIALGLGANYLAPLLSGGAGTAAGAGAGAGTAAGTAGAGGNAGALINAGMAGNVAAAGGNAGALINAGMSGTAGLGTSAGGSLGLGTTASTAANTLMGSTLPAVAGGAAPAGFNLASLAGAIPTSLGDLGTAGSAIWDFAKANPSIAGSLLGAVTSAIGAKNAPTSQTATTSIDPQIKAEYLANLERAKTTAAGLEARQIAQPSAMYTGAEQQLYNLGMTPFGQADIAKFYNPYEEQVVQGALGDIERTRQMQEQANMAQATASKAFGGSRQGVVSGMTNEAALRQAATTGGQLRQAGFNTAANLGLAARPMDIAGLQTSLGLGTTRTALEQARLDALRNLGTERLAITGGALGLQPANVGQTSTQPLYTSQTGSLLSGGLTGAYIGSLLGKA